MRSKKIGICLGLAVFLILGVAGISRAVDKYLMNFNAKYGTAATVLNTCNLCHVAAGPPSTNPYGSDFAVSGYNFTTIEPLDSDGDGYTNIVEINARTFPGNPASHPTGGDTTPPVITTFTVPATYAGLVVPITAFIAGDNVGVTGYLITQSAAKPAASAAGWSATAPTSFTFVAAGAKNLYAWAKDAAGNVSAPFRDTVTITVPAGPPPTVTAFLIPSTSNSLVVPITTFTATDAGSVTGYMITRTAVKPAFNAPGWSVTPPTGFTFGAPGTKTLYGYARNDGGKVSAGVPSTVTITLTDNVIPVVTSFTVPATSTSLTVSITTFTATDNQVVTGYKITRSPIKPGWGAAGWSVTPPTSFTFGGTGPKVLYGYARDGAGNVSKGVKATVTIQ